MNLLGLVQKIVQRTRIGPIPSTTASGAGISGQVLSIVPMVIDADTDIQKRHDDWKFMRGRFVATVGAGTNTIARADLDATIERLYENTLSYSTAVTTDVTTMHFIRWSNFRRYDRLNAPDIGNIGLPLYWTVNDQGDLVFDCYAEADLTMTFEARLVPREMVSDEDVSPIPAQFHNAIFWKAMGYFAEQEEDINMLSIAMSHYEEEMRALESAQLPDQYFTTTAQDETPLQMYTP